MNHKYYFQLLFMVFTTLLPLNVMASDFNILTTGLGSLIIAALLIFICIKASSVAKIKGRAEVIPYSFITILLIALGLALVLEESNHMVRADFYGMLGTILIPGGLAFCVPIFLSRPSVNDK